MNWRDMNEEQPIDGQDCLTKMKHGIIQGQYCKEDKTFNAYYWRSMEWYASEWIPIEEINEKSDDLAE